MSLRLPALRLSLAACTLCASVCSGADGVFPHKPLRFVVPAPAGFSADIAARAIARDLSGKWRQPVIVDNRPGGGTIIGAQAVAVAPPDGYTFGWVIAAHAINPSLHAKLPYDTLRDFSGVTLIYQLRIAIVAPQSLPANNVAELVALLAKRTDFLYTSPAIGSGPHLLGELFKLKYGVPMTHVAYKSAATAHTDVVSGRVPLMFDTLPSALPLLESGKLKLIAVVGDKPVTGHPSFPTLSGLLPRDATTGWNGVVVPSGTPKRVVDKLNADIIAAIRSPDVQNVFATLGVETATCAPEQFDRFIHEEIARWRDVVQRAHITIGEQ